MRMSSTPAAPMSPAELQRMLWSFAAHRTLTVAARTGLLRLLAEGAAEPAELARRLELDPLATAKVLRALCAQGIVEAHATKFRLNEMLRPQFLPGEGDITPSLLHAHQLYDRWGETLEDWLRGNSPPRTTRAGESLRRFSEAMLVSGRLLAAHLLPALDLETVRRVLDVGGGTGALAEALCRASEEIEVTVIDQPEVVELGRERLAGSEIADRAHFRAADYLRDELGTGFDLVLLANVLHQETDVRAAELVRRAAAALAVGGRLAIVDFAIDDEQCRSPIGTLFALNMRSFGDTYTEPTIRAWMKGAGLSEIWRADLTADRWLIVGHRDRLPPGAI